ncbi:MAG: hypothetical protein ACR2O3_02985 [Rhizobiaceae bacterium]
MYQSSLSFRQSAIVYVVGYLIAVPVAVLVAATLSLLPTVFPDDGKWGSFYKELEILHFVVLMGLIYTAMTALPGYAITLVAAHHKCWHGVWFYVAAGFLTAVLAHLLLALFFGGFMLFGMKIFYASFPGGAAGAYCYFLWRKNMLSVWAH